MLQTFHPVRKDTLSIVGIFVQVPLHISSAILKAFVRPGQAKRMFQYYSTQY